MQRARAYAIGEAARLTGVSVETLRYYERLRLLKPAGRTNAGMRRYSADVLKRVRFIKQAQGLGLTLEDIGRLPNGTSVQSHAGCRRVYDLLNRRIADVDTRVAELLALKGTLEQHRRACAEALTKRGESVCPTLDALEAELT